MAYPGRVVKIGDTDAAVIREIAKGLASRGYPATSTAATFDKSLKSLVMLFQSQNVDASGRALKVDGEVGSLTWGALFKAQPIALAPTGAAGGALGVAVSQIGVLEVPLGSNRGPMVDQYLASVGVPPGNFWCMAFVYWCFREAGGGTTQFPKSGGCLAVWNKVKASAPARILTRAQVIADPTLVRPGMVFILDHGGGLGHTGFVRQSIGGALRTIEGNTNPNGSSNGLGVFELNRRNVAEPQLKGFVDFT